MGCAAYNLLRRQRRAARACPAGPEAIAPAPQPVNTVIGSKLSTRCRKLASDCCLTHSRGGGSRQLGVATDTVMGDTMAIDCRIRACVLAASLGCNITSVQAETITSHILPPPWQGTFSAPIIFLTGCGPFENGGAATYYRLPNAGSTTSDAIISFGTSIASASTNGAPYNVYSFAGYMKFNDETSNNPATAGVIIFDHATQGNSTVNPRVNFTNYSEADANGDKIITFNLLLPGGCSLPVTGIFHYVIQTHSP